MLHPIPLRVSNVLDARNKASLPLTLDGTMIADTLVALMPLAKAEDAVYSTQGYIQRTLARSQHS